MPSAPGERGEEEETAFEAARVAGGGYRNIQLGSGTREGRKGRRDEDGCDVLDANRICGNADTHAQEDSGESLRWEGGLLAVSGAVEADDDSVADELVIPYAFD